MTHDITIARTPGLDGGINIALDISRTILEGLQKEGAWSQSVTQEQVSGAGPVIGKITVTVSENG